jgi:hypothetical protein
MNTNQESQKQQQHKQSGGHNPFKPSPSKSLRSTSRRRTPKQNSLQNPAHLHKIMSLFQ